MIGRALPTPFPFTMLRFMREHLAWKLGAVAAVMGGMLLLTAAVAAIALREVLLASEVRAQAQEQARVAYQLRGDVQRYTAFLLEMAWTHTERSQDMALVSQRFAQEIAAAQAAAQTSAQTALLTDLARQQQAYHQLGDQLVSASLAGNDLNAATLWISGKDMAERTYDLADRYYLNQTEQAQQAQALAQSQGQTAMLVLTASVMLALALGVGLTFVLSRRVAQTLGLLTDAAERMASGEATPVVVKSDDELGTLAHAFNAMAVDLTTQRQAQQQWSVQLERQVAVRTNELQTALDQQQQLVDIIRMMSTPVLPVLEGVLVMPLVGVLDSERIVQVQQTLLHGIEQHHAHTIILDITGLPLIDTQVAKQLIMGVQQARLLGAKSLIVGISPEVASTLVHLGIDFGTINTLRDLRTAVLHAVAENRTRQHARDLHRLS